MNQTILPLFATTLMGGGGGPVTRFENIMFLLVAGTMILVAICWGAMEDLVKRKRGRNWPTVSAVIDVVSVTTVEAKGISSTAVHYWPTYLATLTYSYNNPEQQMGDYSRSFANEDDAKAWANSYKGETVKVHVDPRDPTRSVLREEDL
jgi:hypothetical protein